MKAFPLAEDLIGVAKNVIWFEAPEKALADPIRFMAYLMTYGTLDDIAVVRRYIDPDGFREAIENAPPGILDARSWPIGMRWPDTIRRRLCRNDHFRTEPRRASSPPCQTMNDS